MSSFIVNKHRNSRILLILTLLCFGSCKKDWLGLKSDKNQAIPATFQDMQAILDLDNGLYLDGTSLGEIASDGHYTTESVWASISDLNRNAYTWSNDRSYSNQGTGQVSDWNFTYTRVYYANIVLDALKAMSSTNNNNPATFNNIKGQALVHRADAFFKLAQLWAIPYQASSSSSPFGIPLRLDSDPTLPTIRATVQETYNRITADLTEAVNLLPVESALKTRPSKVAALSLLARTHLSMANYGKAGEFADSALKLYNTLMDFNTLPQTANIIGNFKTNPEVILHVVTLPVDGNSLLSINCFIERNLYDSYAENDLRKVIFYKVNTDNTISYKGNYNSNSSFLFTGPATDELYLIRAESYARAGNISLAMKDLNDLLKTRWKKVNGISTYVDQTAGTANEALNKILEERKKELVLRCLRWTDLRRLNLEDNHMTTITRTIGGVTYTLEPNSYKYTFPIPPAIIQISNIPQNPGW